MVLCECTTNVVDTISKTEELDSISKRYLATHRSSDGIQDFYMAGAGVAIVLQSCFTLSCVCPVLMEG